MGRTLGILVNPISQGGVYGVRVAERGLLEAVVRYGTWDKYIIWSDWYSPDCEEKHVSVTQNAPLGDALDGVDCLHHVGLGPARLDRLRGPRPIPAATSVFAALSYQAQVADHLLQYTVRKTKGDVNIVVSKAAADVLDKIYQEFAEGGLEAIAGGGAPTTVIPVGVDTERFAPASEQEKLRLRQKHGLAADRPLAIVISRFSPSDKMDLLPLIQCISRRVAAEEMAGMLLVTGGDQYFGALDYVRLLTDEIGQLGLAETVLCRTENDPSRLLELLRAADVFVSLADSVQETFGITPVEAMACGLPPIVSDWNGYRETVRHGETGMLVPTCWVDAEPIWRVLQATSDDYRVIHTLLGQSVSIDVEAAVDELWEFFRSPSRRAAYGVAARAHAVAEYSWRTVVAKYEETWGEARARSKFRDRSGLHSHIDYARVFRSYPTRMVTDDTLLEVTDWGRKVVTGEEAAVILQEIRTFVSPDDLGAILEAATTRATLREVSASCPDISAPALRLAVGWLIKYGMIVSRGPTA